MANIKDKIRSIIRENFIKEMGINDTHLKAIMKYYYEKRAMRKEKDDEFIRHDCKDRITKLEALLTASSKEKDELRKMVLDMTAKVAELSVKVEFLTKENDKLVKTPRNKKLLNG